MSVELFEINKQYIATDNGLEQVYQNRLVEGVDYQRYDWLKMQGSGLNYIKVISSANWRMRFKKYGNSIVTNLLSHYQEKNGSAIVISLTQEAIYFWETASQRPIYHSLNAGVATLEYNSEETAIYVGAQKRITSKYGGMIRLSTAGVKTTSNVFDLASFEVDDIISLSPCQLLQPIPANLSSTGKPYAQGECGMIDSVSGKFYGNSGSGSFSVYNDPVTE